MKKLLILMSALALMILSCGNSGSRSKSSDGAGTGSKKYRIGITQIASHPALDSAREGFKDAFKEAGIEADFEMQLSQLHRQRMKYQLYFQRLQIHRLLGF